MTIFIYRYICGTCDYNVFDTEGEMMNHRLFCKIAQASGPLRRVDATQIACTLCKESVWATSRAVREHLKEAHASIAIKCDLCEELFFGQKNLKTHMQAMHSDKVNIIVEK